MLTNTVAPRHIEAVGVGLDIAAEMLVTAGDNTAGFPPRRPSPRGATPARSQAGSGKTNGGTASTAAGKPPPPYLAAVRRGH
jgi:transposase